MQNKKPKLPIRGRRNHPLVNLVETHGAAAVGAVIGVDRTSVHKYYVKAVKSCDATIPSEWVISLWRSYGIHPHYWRPDVYPATGVPSL